MGKATGLLTVIAIGGLATATIIHLDRTGDLREAFMPTPAANPPTRSETTLAVAPDGWRAFSQPGSSMPAAAASDVEAPPAPVPQTKPTPVVVTVAPRAAELPSKVAPNLVAGDRVALARELQRELKRVGCYDGEISGIWTPLSRNAMKVFTGRVNAALPVEEPDIILLSLVQGHDERVCNATCPSGQGLAADGRCVPNAILAQAKKSQPVIAAGRPIVPKAAPEQPKTASAGWSTTTAAAPAAPIAPTPALTASAAAASPAAPAPADGRMALSGPALASKVATDAATAVALGMASPAPAPQRTVATKTTSAFGTSFFKQLDSGH